MIDVRNPFRLQAAERIASDTDFLKLFGPGVLDLLPQDAPFSGPMFIRSAPGGGKTSLLKLFTPSMLRTLVDYRSNPDYRELFHRLRRIGAIDDRLPLVTGVMLPCGRPFPDLDDLDLRRPRARRLLMALLDARIMLAALRSVITSRRLKYPEDLSRVGFRALDSIQIPGLSLPCSGHHALEWAEKLETSICNVIDSLDSPVGTGPPGHDSLLMLSLLDNDVIHIDSESPGSPWLLLFDDVERLTSRQRNWLLTTLMEQRSLTTVWIAERLEALSQDELLATGALPGRDFAKVINLEKAWRSPHNPKRFEASIAKIAERRALMVSDLATGDTPGSFSAVINTGLDAPEWDQRIAKALRIVVSRTQAIAARDSKKYAEWVREREELEGTPWEKLLAWRSLEILIERHRRKNQLSLDITLGRDELEDRDKSDVKAAAKLFLAEEFGFPYYYGPSRLASLAFFNVEQYLKLAGDLFEEALSSLLISGGHNGRPSLSPVRQQEILHAAYDDRINQLPLWVKNGRDVMNFLTAVGKFCHEVTHQPNAPYAPGVNGVAISMQERKTLLDFELLKNNPPYMRFAQLLATAVANNLIHAELDKSVKNRQWMILYLNRLFCLKFSLPPHFGGFRERPLTELVSWMDRGYQANTSEKLRL